MNIGGQDMKIWCNLNNTNLCKVAFSWGDLKLWNGQQTIMLLAKTKTNKQKKRKEKHFVWYYMRGWLSPKEMAQPRTSFPGLFPKTNGRGKSLGTRLDYSWLPLLRTPSGWGGGGDLVSLIAGYERKTKFLCTCKSHKHCSFYNYLRILAMDRKRLKIIRL